MSRVCDVLSHSSSGSVANAQGSPTCCPFKSTIRIRSPRETRKERSDGGGMTAGYGFGMGGHDVEGRITTQVDKIGSEGSHRSLISRRLLKDLERAKGFEPSTPTLARLCSTPELRPRSRTEARS